MRVKMRFPGFVLPALFFMLFVCTPVLPAQDRSAARYYEELIGNLTNQVKLLQDENAALASKVGELERKTAAVRVENQSLKQELASLRKLIAADAAERDRQLKSLSLQLEKIAKMPLPAPKAESPRASSSAAAAASPSRPARYEEYTVQPGATLSAIARAYGTKVSEIKKANNLKSDFLRAGQKLLIPLP